MSTDSGAVHAAASREAAETGEPRDAVVRQMHAERLGADKPAGAFTVILEDGTRYDVVPKPYDLHRFEEHFGVTAGEMEELAKAGKARIGWGVYIAWSALQRKHDSIPDDFDEFFASIDTLEYPEDDDEEGKAPAGSEHGDDAPKEPATDDASAAASPGS